MWFPKSIRSNLKPCFTDNRWSLSQRRAGERKRGRRIQNQDGSNMRKQKHVFTNGGDAAGTRATQGDTDPRNTQTRTQETEDVHTQNVSLVFVAFHQTQSRDRSCFPYGRIAKHPLQLRSDWRKEPMVRVRTRRQWDWKWDEGGRLPVTLLKPHLKHTVTPHPAGARRRERRRKMNRFLLFVFYMECLCECRSCWHAADISGGCKHTRVHNTSMLIFLHTHRGPSLPPPHHTRPH